MEIYLINNKGCIDISNATTTVTLSGEYRSCCRELEFGINKSINVSIGDTIRLVEDKMSMFYGIVWNKSKNSNNEVVNINCKDYGIYLKKNTHTYKFRNITAPNIVRTICNDFNIPVGTLANSNTKINRNFINDNLYNIIMTAYTLTTKDNKFFCLFNENKLNILEKGNLVSNDIKQQSNLIGSSVSESLDNVVNRVDIYNHKNEIIKIVKNDDSIRMYGILNDYIKLCKNDKVDYNSKAIKKLKNVEKRITVTNLGDVTFITGYGVIVQEPITGLYCTFFIDEDIHIWKNGLYTNKLVLNLKNIMDKMNDGSLVENITYRKNTSKKAKEDYSIYINKLKE
ncbi:MAG: hypothetical protein N4A63_12875 [Vallitalea sp.]|nr:hypothetical protein [Vallitalea sp.]